MLYLQSCFFFQNCHVVWSCSYISGVRNLPLSSDESGYQIRGKKKNLPFSRKCQSFSHIWFGPNSDEALLTKKNAFLI